MELTEFLKQEAPDEWLETNEHCLWCGSANLEPFVEGVRDWYFEAFPGTFEYARCGHCHSLNLARRPDAQHIGLAYSGYYTHSAGLDEAPGRKPGLSNAIKWAFFSGAYLRYHYKGGRSPIDRLLSKFYVRMERRRNPIDLKYRFLPRPRARVLDYGCGSGDFLRRARALGHEVTGIDFDEQALSVAAGSGIEVFHPGSLDPRALRSRFDMITANHVLEHLADPRAVLADFYDWLAPGGRVFIELPDAEAAGLSRYGRYWRGLEAPRHFGIPSEAGLVGALRDAGFTRFKVLKQHMQAVIAANLDSQAETIIAALGAEASIEPGKAGCDGPEFLTVLASTER